MLPFIIAAFAGAVSAQDLSVNPGAPNRASSSPVVIIDSSRAASSSPTLIIDSSPAASSSATKITSSLSSSVAVITGKSSVRASSTASASATTTDVMDQCAGKCYSAWETCNGAPKTNKADCYSQFSRCIGYFAKPETMPKHCSTSTMKPTSSPTPTGSFEDDCARKCVGAFDECNKKPDCNHSACASELSKCVGYNPFQGRYVQPKKCHTGPPPTGRNVTDTVTITTTYCPAGQTKTTTATWTITACPGGCGGPGGSRPSGSGSGSSGGSGNSGSGNSGSGGSGSGGSGSGGSGSNGSPVVVAGAGRFEVGGALLLAVVGAIALL